MATSKKKGWNKPAYSSGPWDEKAYLKAYPDVAKKIAAGEIGSGKAYYRTQGKDAGQKGFYVTASNSDVNKTSSANSDGNKKPKKKLTNQQKYDAQQRALDKALGGYEDSIGGLVRFYQTAYENYAKKAGLKKMKAGLAGIQKQIDTEKKRLTSSIDAVAGNSNISAATITGQTGRIQELQGNRINNLIDEHNAEAEAYNAAVDEVMQKIGLKAQSVSSRVDLAGAKISTYQDKLGRAGDRVNAEISAINAKADAERWQKEFELEIFKAETSRYSAIKPSSSGSSSGSSSAPGSYNLQSKTVKIMTGVDTLGQPVYSEQSALFDPRTGETTYDFPRVSESGLLDKLREAKDSGYTLEQAKSEVGNAVTDTNKSASFVVDQYWGLLPEPAAPTPITDALKGAGSWIKNFFSNLGK